MEPRRSIEELTRRNVEMIAAIEQAGAQVQSRWERMADRLATFVGSWTFIFIQTGLLFAWIILNISAWIYHWDPYPFILLNLALAFQAAYAAPILMISQNRQAKLSERRNHLDLQINLLAEQETTEILRILRLLSQHVGVRLDQDHNVRALEEQTRPADIVRQIRGKIEEQKEAAVDFREDGNEVSAEVNGTRID